MDSDEEEAADQTTINEVTDRDRSNHYLHTYMSLRRLELTMNPGAPRRFMFLKDAALMFATTIRFRDEVRLSQALYRRKQRAERVDKHRNEGE